MSDKTPSSVPRGHLICVLSMVLFAAGFPAAGALLDSWGPIALISARVVLACSLMLGLWLLVDGPAVVARAPWKRGLLIGGVGFGVGTILLLITQDLTDAVTAALVAAAMPVAAVGLEVLLDRRRLTANFLLGVSLVLAGGILATGADLGEAQFGLGAGLGLIATMIFAWGSRATVKHLPGLGGLAQAAITMIGAMWVCLGILAVCLLFGLPGTTVGALDATGLGLIAVYAFAAMAVSQILWIMGVGQMGVGLASFHLNAVPFYVMLVALAFGGSWSWNQAMGAGLLAIGVVLAQRSDRRRTVIAH